jgi:gamma-glutamylcyclotransferase (GGCT)/AIG2-like uncharacterized protein YtfP
VALYAAYGANLDPARMALRAPASPAVGHGWLQGWRLTFGGEDLNWEGALATVVEDPSESVFVMLYDVPSQDESTLDSWEGTDLGLWRKFRTRIAALDGEEVAWMYVLDDYEGGLPSARYLAAIADAADSAGAPSDYTAHLRNMPCREPEK